LLLAHELRKVLGAVDGLSDFGMLRAQLWYLLVARRCTPHHQPGRLTSGEAPVVGLSDDGEG
jgi:hypothetical protein